MDLSLISNGSLCSEKFGGSFCTSFTVKLLDSGSREPLQDASKNPSKLPQHCPTFLLHFVPNSPLDVNTNYT